MANTQPVTEEQIRTFDEDGVLLLKALINEQWQQTLCESIEQDIANPGPHHHAYEAEGGKGRFHGSMRVWEHNPGFRDYCWNSPLPALAVQFFKTDKINLFYDQLFVKEPSTSNRTSWHNDQPYWRVRGWPVMSFWVALDPVTKETGVVEFIPGSHRWGHWFQPENFAPGVSKSYEQNPDFVKMPDIETEREQHKIVSWDMEPGDVVVFNGRMVHGGSGNLAPDRDLKVFNTQWLGDDVRVLFRPEGMDPDNTAVMTEVGLSSGDRIGTDLYPELWRREPIPA
jgi:ectoine hydroxylase-related dioxygenase (phytanoyl-CoA dioxygenase family)